MRRKLINISTASAFLLLIALSFRYSVADEPIKATQGADPSVETTEIEKALPAPNHPPIDQIPPIPMPELPDMDSPCKSMGPGSGIYYDTETGETKERVKALYFVKF